VRRLLSSLLSQRRIAGGAVVLAVTQFGASLAGLLRDRVLAQTFPPGLDRLDVASVYIAAFRPSDLLFQVFIMSALSVAMVPLLAGHFAHGRGDEMNRLTSSILLVGNLVFGALALILVITLPSLAPSLVQFTGPSLELYVRFAQLTCLSNLLFVSGNALGFVLVTRQVYWVYGLTPILYTLSTVAGTLWLTPLLGPLGPMVGTVGGSVVYVVVRLVAVTKLGYRFTLGSLREPDASRRPAPTLCHPEECRACRGTSRRAGAGLLSMTCGLFHPDLRQMGWMMLPRMFALGALQLELLLFDTMASGLPLGSVTVNAYARNFQSVAVGVIGIALAQSAFSPLSLAHAVGDEKRFSSTLRKATCMTLIASIASALALVLLVDVAGWLVKIADTPVMPLFVTSVLLYSFSIPFESWNHLLLRAFYARKDSLTPAIFSVVNGVTAVGVAWILLPRMGVSALGFGFGIGQGVQACLLRWRIRQVP